MAKIKFGSIVTDGRGKLGGMVFQKQNGVNVLKVNGTQLAKKNLRSGVVKAQTEMLMVLWETLSSAQRKLWEDEKQYYNGTDAFGNVSNLNGFFLFQKLNQGRLKINTSVNLSPSSNRLKYSIENINVTLNYQSIYLQSSLFDSNVTIQIFATKNLPNGVNVPDRYMKELKFVNGTTLSGGINLINEYLSVFGVYDFGYRISFGYKIVNTLSGYSDNVLYILNKKYTYQPTNYYTGASAATPLPFEINSIGSSTSSSATLSVSNTEFYKSYYSLKSSSQLSNAGNIAFSQMLDGNTSYMLVYNSKRVGTGTWAAGINFFHTPGTAFRTYTDDGWSEKFIAFTTGPNPTYNVLFRFYASWGGVLTNELFIDNIHIFKT